MRGQQPLARPGRILSPSPEKLFLVLALAFGMLLVFLTPPFQVPDEPAHLYRAFQIAEGQLVAIKRNGTIGGEIPASFPKTLNIYRILIDDKGERIRLTDIQDSWGLPLKPAERLFTSFPNTACYSPIPYLPQAFGIGIGRILGAPPVALIFLGRICNLAVWILLCSMAIRLVPVCRWLFVLLALTPMSLFEAASLSADVLTNGLAFLTMAFFLALALDTGRKIGRRELTAAIVLTVLLSLSKNAYFLISILFLLIPSGKFRSGKQRFAAFGFLIVANVLALAAWSWIGDSAGTLRILETRMCPSPNVDHVLQLKAIFSDLPGYAGVLARTFVRQFDFYYKSYIGILGWLDTPVPNLLIVATFAMLFVAAIFETSEEIKLSAGNRLALGLYVVGSTGVMVTLLYMAWTTVGAPRIEGVQGRYFIPIAPAFFLLFHNRSRLLGDWHRWLPWLASIFLVLSLIATTSVITRRYYDRHSFSATLEEKGADAVSGPAVPTAMSPQTGFAGLQPAANVRDSSPVADGIAFRSTADDPQLLLPDYSYPDAAMTIKVDLSVPGATVLQIFYQTPRHRSYSEHDSVQAAVVGGRQTVVLTLPAGIVGRIRLDPGKIAGNYVIHSLEIGAAILPRL